MSLSEKMREKMEIFDANVKLKQISYLMPKEDRAKFEDANKLQHEVFKEILEAGIPQKRVQELVGALAIQEHLIKKHKNIIKQRIGR